MEFKEALKRWNGGVSRGAQTRFAKALGINQATVSQWVNGNLQPGEEMLGKVAKLLRISEAESVRMFTRASPLKDSDLRVEVDELREEVARLTALVTTALHLEKGSLRRR